ncbi:MAG: hypothetical protein JWP69_1589 [Flaviaesturariibacter sp.]|nr:hypothetical protein [Flaviaesturariibacter sp.]
MVPPRSKLSPARKRFLKLSLITLGVIILCVFGLHIWFVNNAKSVLKQVVAENSGGKLKLELSALEFEFFDNKIKIREADLTSTDSTTQATTYRVKFRKLTLRVNSFWPLLLQKKLLLDTIKLHDPEVTVTQWKEDTTTRFEKDELSISQQMGKLYNSMLDALDDFGIRRIVINDARLNLVNKIKPGVEPVSISNINFSLIRTAEAARKRDTFLANEQTVDLTTTNQNIALPGGRHRLAFKNFSLELFRKRIVLDSCTISAASTTNSKSNYTIFFKKLLLVGVDFSALYNLNLIKADSVYCENPLFNINLNTLAADPSAKKRERPDPEKIIRELTGDLDLAFVGVKDAGIHINISGSKDRSLFNSNKDDFEMRGLRINGDSVKPVVVQRFDMLVRDYRLYNEDSSSAYTFDSIHFANNKIVLNNFTMQTGLGRKTAASKDFKIPYFELTGLNWFELIFNQNVVAREALLHNPVINLTTTGRNVAKKKKTSFFTSLHTMDNLLTLQKLQVINGQVNMKLGSKTELNLDKVDLSLNSNELLRSNNNDGLRRAVERLSFARGIIRLKDITAELRGARYTGANLIKADQLLVNTRGGNLKAVVRNVAIDNLLLDDDAERVVLDGLHWGQADIAIRKVAKKGGGKKESGDLLLKNISGTNTNFTFTGPGQKASTFLPTIKLASFSKNGTTTPMLSGLSLIGHRLAVASKDMTLNATNYKITDGDSYITNVNMEQVKDRDSVTFTAPRVAFGLDINSMLRQDLHVVYANLTSPFLSISKRSNSSSATATPKPAIRIDRLSLSEPDINVHLHRNDSLTMITLPKRVGSQLAVSGIRLDENTSIDRLVLATTAATFTKPGGEVVGVEKGKLDIDLADLKLTNNGGQPAWSTLINNLSLQTPNDLSMGKGGNRLRLENLALGNLRLSSEYLKDFDKLVKSNVSAWLRTATGQYVDSNTTLNWYNASYNAKNKTLGLDSFIYHPTRSLDSVMATTPYQTDYITFRSGAMLVSDFNLDRYKVDSAIIANTMTITNPVITIYRDKGPPLPVAVVKSLPTGLIKKIPFPVNIKKVNLVDGYLSYTERNAKTRMEGTLVLDRLSGGLADIKNRNIGADDSLQFTLNAWLMDSAEIALRVKQSYTDSLNGFLMTLRMKPTTLSFLNPVLAPLSNVILTSGTIDSLNIRAIGKEDLALGEMKMYYRDLRIKLVKDGNAEETSLLRRAATFLANALIIKKNGNGRTGLIYYERDKSRSFFNYIIRMTFSGMATSIGAKKNRKYMKQYKAELKERNLPPIDFE